MGALGSKDTRRISFENTLAVSPTLTIKKSIEEDTVGVGNFSDHGNEMLFNNETNKSKIYSGDDAEYWANRVEWLQQEHENINKIIETEYEKTMNQLFHSPSITVEKMQRLKPCFEWRSKISRCYEENPRQPLVCAGLIAAFSECVTSVRAEE